jgi:hypothetical protein
MGYIFDEIISDPENGGTLELWNFCIFHYVLGFLIFQMSKWIKWNG